MKYIMLHGLGQSSESWSNTVKVFNDDFEVLCPNLSDWLSGKTPCYDTLYRTLETYCEQFEEPLNICGLSLGGILAMQYAIEHPEKMNSLVLIGTQYEMPKYLLKMQNLIFRIMPCSAFEKMGFQKTDFINLCKSMTELNFNPYCFLCGKTLVKVVFNEDAPTLDFCLINYFKSLKSY